MREKRCPGGEVEADTLAHMRRTTAMLPDDLDLQLRREAARRNMTISEVAREAIERHVGGPPRRLRAAGAGRSRRDDVSKRIKEILAAELIP